MSSYICECCSYATLRKQNYDRHCLSSKHIELMNKLMKSAEKQKKKKEKNEESRENKRYVCKYCPTKFTTKQAMYRHIKYSCKNNEEESFQELVRLMNMKFDKQNKMLQNEIQKRDTAIKRLTKKLEIVNFGATNTMNNTTHSNNKNLNSYNTITNNINNNINIVNFKDTDLSMIPIKRMGIIYSRYVNCVPQCVREAHCNENFPQYMNIYVSNVRGKYVMVYEDNDWQLREREETLEKLIDDKNIQLEEWLDEHGHKYPEMMKKFKHYMTLYNNDNGSLMKKIKERVKIELYNVRKQVKEFNILRTRQMKQVLLIDDDLTNVPVIIQDIVDIEQYEEDFRKLIGNEEFDEIIGLNEDCDIFNEDGDLIPDSDFYDSSDEFSNIIDTKDDDYSIDS